MTAALSLPLILLGVFALACALLCLWLFLRQARAGTVHSAQQATWRERLDAREGELARTREQLAALQGQLSGEQQRSRELGEQLAREQTVREQQQHQYEDKLTLLRQAREELTLQFKQLAGDILEEKGKRFEASSQEKLQALLQPLGEKIQGFEKRVEQSYDKEARERFALEKEIRTLFELNTRISAEAVNLTKALRGENKTQGIWGEMILERVLEKSGLQKGREYDVQVSLLDDDGGKGQPDVVVHLPEGKDIVIDSKVSLSAYQDYYAAEDDDSRATHLRQHLLSIRTHVRGLSDKNYQQLHGLNTLDYVLLFLPVEAAFTLAVQQDEQLFTDAFARNIILVGPSTLLATLRTIQSIWRYEYQNRHAQEIAEQAGRLYDKFVDFVRDLEEIGRRLDQTHKAWDQAHNKLSSGRGNLVGRIEKLRKLGARSSKELPRHLVGDETSALDEPEGDDD
ncbi:MAG TPA: DNA recombination protein RmuC [Hyphomicrobiales bacterium]|nr:DNA recombination protein RmuC [Hyphomicrobiales bacterium]